MESPFLTEKPKKKASKDSKRGLRVEETLFMPDKDKELEPKPQPLENPSEDFISSMIRENLNHARHVENERLTFTSIFTAITGGILTIAQRMEATPLLSVIMIFVLLALNSLCISLITRWNGVFKAHTEKACALVGLVADKYKRAEKESKNEYYIFDFEQEANKDKKYYRTGEIFLWYANTVRVLLYVLLIWYAIVFIKTYLWLLILPIIALIIIPIIARIKNQSILTLLYRSLKNHLF